MHGLGQNYTEEEAGPSSAPENQSSKACREIKTKCHEKLIFLNKTLPLSKKKMQHLDPLWHRRPKKNRFHLDIGIRGEKILQWLGL